ncbi:MAG: FeoC-like transcriptional regulator [bacterium]|nr:FeoC-like transcriptional regulator [bacterium]
MFEEIIEFIKKEKMITINEVLVKFNIDRDMLMYILKYAEKKGVKVRVEKNETLTCSSCPIHRKNK